MSIYFVYVDGRSLVPIATDGIDLDSVRHRPE